MKSTKESSHAFIVRIWIEPREISGAEPIWRGVIERVEDGKQDYVDRLDNVCTYFANYLGEIGIKVDNLNI